MDQSNLGIECCRPVSSMCNPFLLVLLQQLYGHFQPFKAGQELWVPSTVLIPLLPITCANREAQRDAAAQIKCWCVITAGIGFETTTCLFWKSLWGNILHTHRSASLPANLPSVRMFNTWTGRTRARWQHWVALLWASACADSCSSMAASLSRPPHHWKCGRANTQARNSKGKNEYAEDYIYRNVLIFYIAFVTFDSLTGSSAVPPAPKVTSRLQQINSASTSACSYGKYEAALDSSKTKYRWVRSSFTTTD